MKIKVKNPYEWRRSFLWWPVFNYNTSEWIWLEYIEKRKVGIFTLEHGDTEYRPLK